MATGSRNPAHSRALTTNELTIGRRIVMRSTEHHHFNNEVYKVVSEPYEYKSDPSTPFDVLAGMRCIDLRSERTGEVERNFLQDLGTEDELYWNTNFVLAAEDTDVE